MEKRFGFIRDLRRKKGLTLEQLSERANVSKDFIARLERGDRNDASIEKIENILVALDKQLGDVFPQTNQDKELTDFINELQSLPERKRTTNIKIFREIMKLEQNEY